MEEFAEDDLEGSVVGGPNEDALLLPIALAAGADLGVQKWARTPNDVLMTHLGFLGGRPALFAAWRSRRGGDGSNWKSLDDIPHADREAITLLWHQAGAVAALSELFWTEKVVDGGVPGVLLADNVGLGKTVELMGLIAMIVQTKMAEDNPSGVRANILSESDQSLSCAAFNAEAAPSAFRLPHPSATANLTLVALHTAFHADAFSPRAENRPYFCGLADDDGRVPDLPIAIIVPVSLAAQWLAELKTFIGPGNIEVYTFPSAEAEWADFWAPDSAWSRSIQPKHLRIILFQHSVRSALLSKWCSSH